jgi:hypothetical protein
MTSHVLSLSPALRLKLLQYAEAAEPKPRSRTSALDELRKLGQPISGLLVCPSSAVATTHCARLRTCASLGRAAGSTPRRSPFYSGGLSSSLPRFRVDADHAADSLVRLL